MTARRRLIIAPMAAVLLVSVVPALAQVRRIQGKVVDDEGQPVAGAAIEAIIVSLADADFAVRNNDQTWRTQTTSNGDYTVTVPVARAYLVTATKEGVGSDRRRVDVQQNAPITANLTLWKDRAAPTARRNCGNNPSVGAFERSGLTAAADPGLVRLLGWLEAVHLHTPGCSDPPAMEVGRWSTSALETLLRDVRELVKFLQRTADERTEFAERGSSRRDQLVFFIYGRRLTLDDLQRTFYGSQALRANELLLRAAVMHADIAMFVPGGLADEPLVADGGQRGWRRGTVHWDAGRQLLDGVMPGPAGNADAVLWYRAVSAHLFREGELARVTTHLNRARQVFPQEPVFLRDSGYLHQELASPAIQAAVQELRSADVDVRVSSRVAELQRTERFFRDALALTPDDADVRLRLGHTLGELGRHREAAAELRAAIGANPDRRGLYFAELFLGREEEALGRAAEAIRHYELAAGLYPGAQSPRLALSRLAGQTGDRASAQRSLRYLAASPDADSSDPWWEFYRPHQHDAAILMDRMRRIGTTQ
jgi:tetratricopeptide (TPR) repeat protein